MIIQIQELDKESDYMKINRFFVLSELEKIRSSKIKPNLKDIINKNPKTINYLKTKDITNEIITVIFKNNIDDLFDNILIKDSCMYNYLLKIYIYKYNNIPKGVIINQDIINELVLLNPEFAKYLIKNKYYNYLSDFVLKILIIYGKDLRLTKIPKNLLTEELILLATSRSEYALTKISEKKRLEIENIVKNKDNLYNKTIYKELKEKSDELKRLIEEQENLELRQYHIPKLITIANDYYNNPITNLKSYCKVNKIKEPILNYSLDVLENYKKEITDIKNNENSKKEIIESIIKQLQDNIENGIKSPENNIKIKLNAALYYLYYDIDINELISILNSQKRIGLKNNMINYVRRAYDSKNIDEFYNTKLLFDNKSVTQETKFKIEEFMHNNNIPLKHAIAIQVLNLYKSKDIDINKIYKVKQNNNDIQNKIELIKLQEEILNNLDKKIHNLKQERKELILKW